MIFMLQTADIEAAHEAAANALAQLAYVEARHALSKARSSNPVSAASHPITSLSDHLDFSEFLGRQTNFLQVGP